MPELDLDQLKINSQELKTVKDVLSLEVPDTSVIAFGSRVTGQSRPYSDLDLALMTEVPLSLSKIASIKDAFDRSDLVWPVDIVDWSTTSERFRKIIKAAYIRI
jgi:predicted nucleotidyltransferase